MAKIRQSSEHQGQIFGYNPISDEIVPLYSCFDGSLSTLDIAHKQVHAGTFFTVAKVFTGIATDGYASIRLKPTTKIVHFEIYTTAEGKAYLKTYSGSTYSNDGTAYTPFNRNALSSNLATCEVYLNPTVNVLGTLRGDDLLGSAGGTSRAGGQSGDRTESVIGAGNDILIRVQNKDNSTRDIGIIINFYEV